MKNAVDGLINRLVRAKEIISEVKEVPLEISQTEKAERKEERKIIEYIVTVEQLQKS